MLHIMLEEITLSRHSYQMRLRYIHSPCSREEHFDRIVSTRVLSRFQNLELSLCQHAVVADTRKRAAAACKLLCTLKNCLLREFVNMSVIDSTT